jgi:uncharacterized UPF0160 family protein
MIEFCIDTKLSEVPALEVGTHNGSFHADEVFATAILLQTYGKLAVVRTRDQAILDGQAVVLDVGGVYDPRASRFDHHQKGGARSRSDGTPYATAGLVWQAYGVSLLKRLAPELSDSQAQEVHSRMDADFFRHIDAIDCGIDVAGPVAIQASSLISGFNPNWYESPDFDAGFERAVQFASTIVVNQVRELVGTVTARGFVDAAPTEQDGQVLVLKTFVPWAEQVIRNKPDVRFVVFPDVTNGWRVQVVPESEVGYKARKDLPAAWAGLRGEDLDGVTGVLGGVFCHNGRFICGHQTKEGALELARLAVDA